MHGLGTRIIPLYVSLKTMSQAAGKEGTTSHRCEATCKALNVTPGGPVGSQTSEKFNKPV